ncbi:septation inhibitor protein [Pseudoclavibacter sp. AY1F1]|uniref:Cell division protein CrgA n=1 Tax=Pseudoclavibacter helvolus TaxID=255205 RepID=A0A7W4YHR3_9MICO|nr:hypothetical protein [Pseudoclavibacter helvolus]PPF45559.1 septation inhibitor protein [Pseudoclavibacter sp. AY1F1]
MSREKSSGSKSDEPEKKTPAGTKKHRSSEASAAAAALAATEKQRRQKRAAGVSDSDERNPNPVWFKPLMFGFLIVGFLWIILFYLTSGALPIAELGSWNILVGFGIAFIGFIMTTNWR